MGKKVILNEKQIKFLFENLVQEIDDNIIQYIKSFGEKGKLPTFNDSLKSLYTPFLKQAYEWASEKIDEIKRYGFPFFVSNFKTNVIGKFTISKRNLIYVERSIDIDTTSLNALDFKSLGECWSWKKGNSNSYCADFSLLNNNVVNVVICGYVHPDSIDWLETIYLNSYDMKNETEIRMRDNAYVEVAYIKIQGRKKLIGGSLLLNASAEKYKK